MKISFTTAVDNIQLANGFGVGSFQIIRSLQKLGHSVPFQDPDAPVEFAFVQPDLVKWSNPNAYHILLTPWESEVIPDRWTKGIFSADEFWTTSPKCRGWFENAGYKVDQVYLHGVDPIWSQKPRKRGAKIKFLHVGEPAPRKMGQMTYDTFVETFGDREDVSLTIKAHNMSTIRGKDNKLPQHLHKNVKVITREMTEEELVNLYHQHDVLVYPSVAEGFGFIPLQAMATGMPTICVPDWADYKDWLLESLTLKTTLVPSPWPQMHPGHVYWPAAGELREKMLYAVDNFEALSAASLLMSTLVHRKYDWVTLTKNAFAHVVERFDNV